MLLNSCKMLHSDRLLDICAAAANTCTSKLSEFLTFYLLGEISVTVDWFLDAMRLVLLGKTRKRSGVLENDTGVSGARSQL